MRVAVHVLMEQKERECSVSIRLAHAVLDWAQRYRVAHAKFVKQVSILRQPCAPANHVHQATLKINQEVASVKHVKKTRTLRQATNFAGRAQAGFSANRRRPSVSRNVLQESIGYPDP